MKRVDSILLAWAVLMAPCLGDRGWAAGPVDLARIQPFTDSYTVAVARLDLSRFDWSAWSAAVLGAVPDQHEALAQPLAFAQAAVQVWLDALSEARATAVYAIVSLTYLSQSPPVLVVVPLGEGGQPERLERLLTQEGPTRDLQVVVRNGCLVAAPPAVHRQLESVQARVPDALPAAFGALPLSFLQVALLPYPGSDRVIEELMPTLPRLMGGGSSAVLTRGWRWAVLSVEGPPEGTLLAHVQSRSAGDAEGLRAAVVKTLAALGQLDQVRQAVAGWDEVQRTLAPALAGDALRVRIDQPRLAELARSLVWPALDEARDRAQRMVTLGNLKQIGLALLMYANDHGDRLPSHLADTLKYLESPAPLLLPGSDVPPPPDLLGQDRTAQVQWVDRHTAFIYVGAGAAIKAIKDPARTPLAYQKFETSQEPFAGVVFADGHAEYLAQEVLKDRLTQSSRPAP